MKTNIQIAEELKKRIKRSHKISTKKAQRRTARKLKQKYAQSTEKWLKQSTYVVKLQNI
jgi:hypothetical protein